jgi:hypothetical protein
MVPIATQGRGPERAVTKKELEALLEQAADAALDARRRIEAAVDGGELPVWLLDTLSQWERAAMLYGAARAQLRGEPLQSDDLPAAPLTVVAAGRSREPGPPGRH